MTHLNGRRKTPFPEITTPQWFTLAAELAAREPHYQDKAGNPAWYHLAAAALKCGHKVIDDSNVRAVIEVLETRKEPKPTMKQALDALASATLNTGQVAMALAAVVEAYDTEELPFTDLEGIV